MNFAVMAKRELTVFIYVNYTRHTLIHNGWSAVEVGVLTLNESNAFFLILRIHINKIGHTVFVRPYEDAPIAYNKLCASDLPHTQIKTICKRFFFSFKSNGSI